MNKYKVRVSVEVDYFTEVEAEDEQEAKEIAIDDAEFDVQGGEIYSTDVIEIEEIK